jgi:hypothetical protein
MDIWHRGIAHTDVRTTPDRAKITLHSIDRGVGATISTIYGPSRVYYVSSHPGNLTFLQVSYPGYKTQIIHLGPVNNQSNQI